MTKRPVAPTTDRRRDPGSPLRSAPPAPILVLPPLTGRPVVGALPRGVVVSPGQIAQLPDAGRRLFAQGLTQIVQRRTTSDAALSVQRQPNPLQPRATTVLRQLRALIAGADWPTIRRQVYPHQSAAGIARAKDRRSGKATDLTGLGQIASLDRFAAAMKAIQTEWPRKSVRERIDAIGAAANAELTRAGVPTFLIVDKMSMVAKGMFSGGAWAFYLNEALVSSPTLDAATAGMVANAAMHESRHAEQHFLAARYSAGFNKTDQAGLVAEQGLPDSIAAAAVRQKFNAMSDMAVATLGQRMFKAFVTDEATSRANADALDPARDVMTEKKTLAEAEASALTTTVSATTVAAAERSRDALSASIAEVERTYALYRSVPYEADAHEVGDAAELAFKGGP